MEKFVIEIHWGDGYTFSATETCCIEYSSIEALYSDLVDEYRKNQKLQNWEFEFEGMEFTIESMNPNDYEGHFRIFSLDEWVEKELKDQKRFRETMKAVKES